MHEKHASYLFSNPTDYNYRLQCHLDIMRNDGFWRAKKEFHEDELLGTLVYDKWSEGEEVDESWYNSITRAILSSNNKFIMTSHNVEKINKISKLWEDVTVVSLINVEKFWNIAEPLKRQTDDPYGFKNSSGNECEVHYNFLRGDDWPLWDEFMLVNYNIDRLSSKYPHNIVSEIKELYKWYSVKNKVISFDMGSIFSERMFLETIEKLYNELEFSDYNSELISKYWREYVQFHGIENFDLMKS
jgi:hypothetical protein